MKKGHDLRKILAEVLYVTTITFLVSCAHQPPLESTEPSILEGKIPNEQVAPQQSEAKITERAQLSEEDEFNLEIKNTSVFNALRLCHSKSNKAACDHFKYLCDKGDALACHNYAVHILNRAEDSGWYNSKARNEAIKYLGVACKKNISDSCSGLNKLLKIETDEALAAKRLELKEKIFSTKCAATELEIVLNLGPPESRASCTDNIYSALLYGRHWILLKSDSAFLIMDHSNYNGPCLTNHAYYNWGHYTGFEICR